MRPPLAYLAVGLFALSSSAAEPSAADKAIDQAVALLEKAADAAKTLEDREKLTAAIAALKKTKDGPTKPQNELVSDFADNAQKYKGRTVTFQVEYISQSSAGRPSLRQHLARSDKLVLKAIDSKNDAKVYISVEVPKNLDVPNAMEGEEIVVTFKCTGGSTDRGNVAEKISRPK